MRKQATINDILHDIQPGDIIAFGGYSLFSRWTKLTTGSNVTHMAVVTATQVDEKSGIPQDHVVFESTVRNHKWGVMQNSMLERIAEYPGDVWWLPLSGVNRERFQDKNDIAMEFIESEDGGEYDIWQLFGAAVDIWDNHRWLRWLTWNPTKLDQWFCSELIAELFNRTGLLTDVNPSETTPRDLCRFQLYAPYYTQIKGQKKSIKKYNSTESEKWGQILTEGDEDKSKKPA